MHEKKLIDTNIQENKRNEQQRKEKQKQKQENTM